MHSRTGREAEDWESRNSHESLGDTYCVAVCGNESKANSAEALYIRNAVNEDNHLIFQLQEG